MIGTAMINQTMPLNTDTLLSTDTISFVTVVKSVETKTGIRFSVISITQSAAIKDAKCRRAAAKFPQNNQLSFLENIDFEMNLEGESRRGSIFCFLFFLFFLFI
jgi:hypothetical protein